MSCLSWRNCRGLLIAGVLAAPLGCTTTGGANWSGAQLGSGTLPERVSGAPELVGTATIPQDSAAPAAAAAAARVLYAVGWPVLAEDSAQNMLNSDWQYFAPGTRLVPTTTRCRYPLELRFRVAPLAEHWHRAQIVAEAYFPRTFRGGGFTPRSRAEYESDLREARGYTRETLKLFRQAVLAAENNGAPAEKAASSLYEMLTLGRFQLCAGDER